MTEPGSPDRESIAKISGRRKAAMLCVSLGPEAAAEIMRELPQDLVELLTVEMARTPTVNGPVADAVLQEVVETAHARGYLSEGGVAYARAVLAKALGEKQADEISRASRRSSRSRRSSSSAACRPTTSPTSSGRSTRRRSRS